MGVKTTFFDFMTLITTSPSVAGIIFAELVGHVAQLLTPSLVLEKLSQKDFLNNSYRVSQYGHIAQW